MTALPAHKLPPLPPSPLKPKRDPGRDKKSIFGQWSPGAAAWFLLGVFVGALTILVLNIYVSI